LSGGPEGATCARVDRTPDLVLDAAELGAIVLGGVRPSLLARAGRLRVSDPAALGRADAMFDTGIAPYAATWF
jgi:predicted acetyltransferase